MGPPVIRLREEGNEVAELTVAEMEWLIRLMPTVQYAVTDVYILFGMAARFGDAWVINPRHMEILESICQP